MPGRKGISLKRREPRKKKFTRRVHFIADNQIGKLELYYRHESPPEPDEIRAYCEELIKLVKLSEEPGFDDKRIQTFQESTPWPDPST